MGLVVECDQIQFKPGHENANADMLSRLPLSESPKLVPIPGELVLLLETLQSSPISASLVRRWTDRDCILSVVRELLLKGWSQCDSPDFVPYQRRHTELSVQDGLVLWGNRVVIPLSGRAAVLSLLHEGHLGICRMKQLARSFVWWPAGLGRSTLQST